MEVLSRRAWKDESAAARQAVTDLGGMEIRDRILAGVATPDSNGDTVTTDVTTLVHRLVLFEEVLLDSIRLKEIPALVRAFGPDGLELLLETGALRIACEALTLGQTGQLVALQSRVEKGLLPLGSYSFALVQYHDRREYLHGCLQEVHRAEGLSLKRAIRLKRNLVARILPTPDVAGVEAALIHDVVGNRNLVQRALQMALARERNVEIPAPDLRVAVHQLDESDIRVETNLQPLLSLDLPAEHEIVMRALLGVGGLNLRIANMQAREAVAALDEDELPLLDDKLSFLVRDVLPNEQERRFERVISLTDLVEPDLTEPRSVNVERLLDIRSSAEVREFRHWLRSSDGLSDDALKELLPGVRERLATAVRGRAGRAARFAVSTGAGLAAGDVSGTGVGAIDSFLLDRLLPRPGPLAWLSLTYPSVFEGR